MLGKPIGGGLSSDRPEDIPEELLDELIAEERKSGRYDIGNGKG
jgi:hypothetical protein